MLLKLVHFPQIKMLLREVAMSTNEEMRIDERRKYVKLMESLFA